NSYTNGELHVNFKLSKSGSSIGLFAFDTAMVDSVTFGAQVADISEGRYPDGGSDIRQLNPTPGSANALPASSLTLAAPGDQFVYPGETLNLQFKASGGQGGETLTYALLSSGASGPAIDPTAGLFTWVVAPSQLPGTTPFEVRVESSGDVRDSASASFNVIT